MLLTLILFGTSMSNNLWNMPLFEVGSSSQYSPLYWSTNTNQFPLILDHKSNNWPRQLRPRWFGLGLLDYMRTDMCTRKDVSLELKLTVSIYKHNFFCSSSFCVWHAFSPARCELNTSQNHNLITRIFITLNAHADENFIIEKENTYRLTRSIEITFTE